MAKLLLVDDEAQFIDMVQMRLEASGYDVITANDGEQGLKAAKDGQPDLIILDIMMPVMDGNEMLKELRKDEQIKHIPVLLCSAKAQKEDVANGHDSGADDFIKKPFETTEFLSKIENLLNKSS